MQEKINVYRFLVEKLKERATYKALAYMGE
jgi:hypothetical protein